MKLVTAPKAPRQRLRRSQWVSLSDLGRLALGVSTGALLGGYGRASYAGTCAPSALGVYQCAGAANVATDSTQSFAPGGTADIVVTSDPGFGLDTRVTGGDGISASRSSGNIVITTSGVVAAEDGIEARTSGNFYDYAGDITITTGDISGGRRGVSTRSYIGGFSGKTYIDTTAGTVFGGEIGIAASSEFEYYSGDITIKTADVIGGDRGISASNDAFGGAIVIDTTAGAVTAGQTGISASPGYSSEGARITTADVNAITGVGINASGGASVNTTAGTVTAGTDGVRWRVFENGFAGIETGDIVAGQIGVSAYGQGASINTTGGHVEAGDIGIDSRICCYTSSIKTSDVTANSDGIRAHSYGRELSIDTTAGTVTGGRDGIYARSGSRVTVDISTADVTGDRYGIRANEGYFLTIDTTGGTVTGGTDGISISVSDSELIRLSTADVIAGAGSATESVDDQDVVIETVGGSSLATTAGAPKSAAGIRLTGEAFDGAAIEVAGHVSGDVGIDAAGFESDVDIKSSGLIEGRNGVAVDLGDGQQSLAIFDQITGLGDSGQQGIIGTTYFGGGDDMLSFVDTVGGGNILYDGMFTDLFDGGSETDTVLFSVAIEDLKSLEGEDSFLQLFFQGEADERAILSLVNFELFGFADNPEVTYTVDELRSIVAPVPVPTGVLLLGSALGAMGFAKLKRRRMRHPAG